MAAANNLFAVVVAPESLGDTAASYAEARALLDYFRSSRPADPDQPVTVPGDIEARTRAERLQTGIALNLETWDQLRELARSLGVPCVDPATALT
jgi:uncharacterized oxidoreductase